MSKPLLVGGLLLLGASQLGTTWRLQQLLRVQGVAIGLLSLFRLNLIGQFFSTVIPGAVGGDLVKMGYLARLAPDRVPEAVLTVFVDRLVGLLGLMIVALLACLLNLDFVRHAQGSLLWLLVGAFGIGAALFVLLLLAWMVPTPSPARLVGRILGRVRSGLKQFAGHPASLAQAVAVSMLTHSMVAALPWMLGRGLGEESLSFLEYYLAVVIANALSALPITPAGLGSRDWIMAQFLQAEGAVKPFWGAIPALFSCCLVFWCLMGGVLLVVAPGIRRAQPDSVS